MRPTKDTTEFSRMWSHMKRSDHTVWYEKHRFGASADKLVAAMVQQFHGKRVRCIFALIKKPSDIIDLGCGLLGREVFGCDGKCDSIYQPETYDQTHIIKSWRGIDVPEQLNNARVRSADICNSGELAESYDVVVLNRSLMSGKEAVAASLILAEAYRVLRPGGILVGAAPLPHVNRQNEWNSGVPDEQVSKDLKDLMKSAGFMRCRAPLVRAKGERARSEDVYFHATKP